MSNHALWISRHPMDVAGEEELKRIFLVDGIDRVDFAFSEDPEKALSELKELVEDYKIFGGVFPSQLWFALLKHVCRTNLFDGKEIFLVVSKSLPLENGIRKFQFDHFEFLMF